MKSRASGALLPSDDYLMEFTHLRACSAYSLKYGTTQPYDLVARASELGMPHIEMTVEMLRDFGATVHVDATKKTWRVEPGALLGKDMVIEPDLSNAAPFLSIAMVCGGSITIADWPQKTTQPAEISVLRSV